MFGIRRLRGVFEVRSKTRGCQIRVAVFSCLLLKVVGTIYPRILDIQIQQVANVLLCNLKAPHSNP